MCEKLSCVVVELSCVTCIEPPCVACVAFSCLSCVRYVRGWIVLPLSNTRSLNFIPCVTLGFVVSLWRRTCEKLSCVVLHELHSVVWDTWWIVLHCLCKILFEDIRSACCNTHWAEWKRGNSDCHHDNVEWRFIVHEKEVQEQETLVTLCFGAGCEKLWVKRKLVESKMQEWKSKSSRKKTPIISV